MPLSFEATVVGGQDLSLGLEFGERYKFVFLDTESLEEPALVVYSVTRGHCPGIFLRLSQGVSYLSRSDQGLCLGFLNGRIVIDQHNEAKAVPQIGQVRASNIMTDIYVISS